MAVFLHSIFVRRHFSVDMSCVHATRKQDGSNQILSLEVVQWQRVHRAIFTFRESKYAAHLEFMTTSPLHCAEAWAAIKKIVRSLIQNWVHTPFLLPTIFFYYLKLHFHCASCVARGAIAHGEYKFIHGEGKTATKIEFIYRKYWWSQIVCVHMYAMNGSCAMQNSCDAEETERRSRKKPYRQARRMRSDCCASHVWMKLSCRNEITMCECVCVWCWAANASKVFNVVSNPLTHYLLLLLMLCIFLFYKSFLLSETEIMSKLYM